MRIVISGASGMVGRWLVPELQVQGHEVVRLVRSDPAAEAYDAAHWDPAAGRLDPTVLEDADAVVNLSGRNIGGGRWTEALKQDLRRSRLDSTRTLVRAMAEADHPPAVLVNASAVGIYGDRGDEEVDESAPSGDDFLAQLTRDWEAAALEAEAAGARVALMRLGVVVGRGGALARMLAPFRLGLGGPVGSGRQWWSWVGMEDVIGAFVLALANAEARGPINVVSPNPVTSAEFARVLGRVVRRPAILPLPAFAARLALGEAADALLLGSTRVRPAVLEALGYDFRLPTLDPAIRQALD